MRRNSQDRIGKVGKILAVTTGAVGGAAGASTVAAGAGVTAIPVLTTVGSWLGVTVLAATPAGWLVGCGIAGGLLMAGCAKIAHRHAKHQQRKKTEIWIEE